jgi:phosphoglycolate phosphatase
LVQRRILLRHREGSGLRERSLVLFDIDATLVTTSKAGIKSMQDAGRALYSDTFSIDGVNFAGRLDPLIIDDLLEANGLEATPTRRKEMRAGYGEYLGERLKLAGIASALGGVIELVDRLSAQVSVALGLLTGNFPETGRLKLGASGISTDWFTIQVWGCDSPHEPPARDHLPAVAFERYVERFGEPIDSGATCVIGDTPHDVACAKAHGCRSIGVATGMFGASDLASAGADLVVEDLTETDALVAWLVGR